jgi:type I restriction-modification system DNA methylase subunit
MPAIFTSTRQEKLFRRVITNLERLGYRGELLPQPYSFVDWFLPNTPQKEIPAAAFGRTPQSYDSACFAVLLANGKTGAELVNDCRALGAPFALTVQEETISHWKVGREPNATIEQRVIPAKNIERVFQEHQHEWSSQGILRLKNVGFTLEPRQIDFIDLGLIPALEREIQTKLHVLLSEVITEAVAIYQRNTSQQPAERELFRLVFRFLAAKVLHDRGIPPFRDFTDFTDTGMVLSEVDRYYGEPRSGLQDAATQQVIATNLWNRVDFRNLSVEVLAYIYENTLVDEASRKELSIHSTPHSIARYIVRRLPFETIARGQRRVVEPFAGHGIFLVAALQRLRDLLHGDMDAAARHRYFVRMLQGFERDPFALEVATLCLMLADFPNPNGWQLHNEDVFTSEKFASVARQARVVLCNPPFESFSSEERHQYDVRQTVQKPAAFLYRLFDVLPAPGLLGMVLPHQFLDGQSYREIRRLLAQRFQDLEVVALPDEIFRHSQVESALLIAKAPRTQEPHRLTVTYTEVREKDRERFVTTYGYSRRESQTKTSQEAAESLTVIALRAIWDRLADFPRLGDVAEIHRGVEWQPPFDPDKYLSDTEKPGFARGLRSASRSLCFQVPPSEYLSVKPADRRGNAFDLPWKQPKVIMNAVRVSRGPWKIAAFADDTGLVCSQNFHVVWSKDQQWTPKGLAAVLNAPVACAFVAIQESKHIRKQTLLRVPLPRLNATDIEVLDGAVDHYLHIVDSLFDASTWFQKESARRIPYSVAEEVKRALLRIDALVLKGYNLPPRLERQLLDFFRGSDRPVPFAFDAYFPESFSATIPLWLYISPEYQQCTVDYFLSRIPEITDPALIEALQEVE